MPKYEVIRWLYNRHTIVVDAATEQAAIEIARDLDYRDPAWEQSPYGLEFEYEIGDVLDQQGPAESANK